MDSTAAPDVGQAGAIGDLTREIVRRHPDETLSYVRVLEPAWLEAGTSWLATGGWRPAEDSIVPTLGAHAAVLAVIAAVTAPGDKIVFEQLTYSSIARSANLIGRRSVTVELDEDGIDPEDFERLCAQQHPKLAFLMPVLHNPTLTIMPEARRRDIAAIARKYHVWLVEDAIYATLLDEAPVTFAELAPELTFHVGGLSKAVAAGIRGGWVACPPHFAPRVLTSSKMLLGREELSTSRTGGAVGALRRGRAHSHAGQGRNNGPRGDRARALRRLRIRLTRARAVHLDEAAGALAFRDFQAGGSQ